MTEKEEQNGLKEKINKIDEQISALSALRKKYTDELNTLPDCENFKVSEAKSSKELSPEEKIQLFRSYFKGRNDVYARLWVSSNKQKRGYSPVCKHEWDRALCKKPVIKCSECSNKEFSPLDEDAVRRHLLGNQVAGIYPMLQNEHCYFLAIDFDKEGWFEDIKALTITSKEEGIPVVIERSRSGSGGHVWIFFEKELPAILARKLGSYLITMTMSKRYQIDMKSYDRLFPNQDTMPKGGFGNLIALPFQKEAVNNGNSVFIDDAGLPYPDQWTFLASIRKMSFDDVQKKVDEGIKSGQIISVLQSQVDENDEPWTRLPSGKRKFKVELKDLPDSLEVVLANRIYIKEDAAPPALLNQLKHLAAFQNPEFYKKQKMRFSTHATPRVICCAEISGGYLSLPRGCIKDIDILLKEHKVKLKVIDKRFKGRKVSFKFKGTLNDEQENAIKYMLSSDFGVLVAPPGSGKTVLAVAAMAKRNTNILILVHRKPIMDQWRLQISALLGIDKKKIGQIGGGKNKSTGVIDIAMVQSLDNDKKVDDRVADYGFVIVDECHHVSAFSFEKVLTQAKAKYVLGLTATPYRRDGHQPIIYMQCGPICHQIKQKDSSYHLSESKVLARKTSFSYAWNDNSKIHDVLIALVSDEQRNRLIVDDIVKALNEGRFPLVLTERREHLERLLEMLKGKADYISVLQGGMGKKKAKEVFEKLKEFPENCRKIILATGSYIGEGFDEPRLDTLFLTMPSSFKGKIVQYTGRLHRYHKEKKNIHIYDYVDLNVSMLDRMFQRRMKTYKMLDYTIHTEAEAENLL
ncbi:MAG: hypothetical protein A2452_02570 [Candidatus Firestonebacteria bacterium RIFOXYC2_FULL_39_67]|nr:MAG: hypothetical protein A2536_06905 [Candidatus Firestonebacteria bacterium RIFOXYD2_FULL_39_29]OGF54004.1 MAG: hypothetical protein A2452_02570 [Candidatus Firestonebacteria bacterium RIFOXYC2_FULL_39_67]OGF57164.1 MAG: hypothetical protein A2497_02320 [Candidatus Firestonebacteria bacterium RifOxyC12_full_39_7]